MRSRSLSCVAQVVADTANQRVRQIRADCVTVTVAGKITKLQRKSLGALITIDVHARDVMKKLANEGVAVKSDFGWMSQMRYYWQAEEKEARGGRASIVALKPMRLLLRAGLYEESVTVPRQQISAPHQMAQH